MSRYLEMDFRWIFYAALGVSFFAPFSLNTFFVVLAIMAGLLKFNKEVFFINLKQNSFIWWSASFFVWYLLSLCWTSNIAEGWNEIVSKLPFIVIPFALAGSVPLSRQMSRYSLYGFILGTILAMLICVGFSISELIVNPANYANPIDAFTYEHLSKRLHIQPIYLALFTICAFFFLFFEHVWRRNKFHPAIIISLVLFWLFIIMLSSRMEIMVFLVTFGLCVALWAYQTKRFIVASSVLILAGAITFGIIVINPTNKERFGEMVDTKADYKENKYGGRAIRIQKWLNTVEVVRMQPVLGVGAGDYWDELSKIYKKNNFELALQLGFNTHNQFLQTAASVGLIGLILFLGIIYSAVIAAFRQRNLPLLIFLIIFILSCITESMLERQWGIVLFSFYSSFLLMVYSSPQKKYDD